MTNTSIPLQTTNTKIPNIQKQNKKVFINTTNLIEITNTIPQNINILINNISINKSLNNKLLNSILNTTSIKNNSKNHILILNSIPYTLINKFIHSTSIHYTLIYYTSINHTLMNYTLINQNIQHTQ